MTTLWVTGANGVLGYSAVRQAAASGAYRRIVALGHQAVPAASAEGLGASVEWRVADLRDHAALDTLAETAAPGAIIHCAAMTNVDGCETERDLAWEINAEAPRALARLAQRHGARLLHVSTDYVFPGDDAQPGPYGEADPTRPVSHYGASKLGGEVAIREEMGAAGDWLVARTAIVIGTGPNGRPNFVTWLARELAAGRRVRIVTDQINTPTLADDLAAYLLWQAPRAGRGIYHTTGPTLLGRHEWALAIAAHFGLPTDLIDTVTTAELNQRAQRPLRGGLRCERLAADVAAGAPAFRGAIECLATTDWGIERAPTAAPVATQARQG